MTYSFSGISDNNARLKWLALLPLILVLTISQALSQVYYFDNYSTQDGLGQSTVYSIVQDSSGYVWLGTLDGVSRFNGKDFENYTAANGLAPGGVKTILIDKKYRFWFGHHNGGLTRYDGQQFTQVSDSILPNDKDITTLIEDAKGKLWIGTYGNGAFVIQNPGSEPENFDIINYKGGRLSDIVFGGTIALSNDLFLITDVGIKRYREELRTFINFQPEGHPTYFFKTTMFEDSKGNVWYGTRNGGLIKQHRTGEEFNIYDTRDGLETNFIWTIFEDSRGSIWTSNLDDRNINGGLTRITNSHFQRYNKNNGLTDNKIHCLYEDYEGNILIGTRNNGLCIFKGDHLITYREGEESLLDNNISCVFEDPYGRIWAGGDEGINIISRPLEKDQKIEYVYDRNSILRNPVKFIDSDQNGNIWIGTEGGGIYTVPAGKRQMEFDPVLNYYVFPGDQDRIITMLLTDKNNILWIGTSEGLVEYHPGNEMKIRRRQEDGLSGNNISAIYSDPRSNLWIGSINSGVSFYNAQTGKFSPVVNIPAITPTCFIMDNLGKLWIGTESSGLLIFDGDTVIRSIRTDDGILSNLIKLLAIDNDNNIYIGTNKGLNKYDPEKNRFYGYSKKDGFTGIETNYLASCNDSKGKLWFGTVEGLTCYDPERDNNIEAPPKTYIHDFIVGRQKMPLKNGIKLNSSQNSISFNYQCVSLADPDAVQYLYMLEGNDTEWLGPTSRTTVKYDRLPPGSYTFKLLAKNNTNIWNEKPVTFSFFIDKPFYLKWYSIISSVGIIVLMIIMFIKIRESQLIREKRFLEDKVRERTLALSNANEELEKRNREFTASIRYAKRIQFAILPPEIPFENCFVFFRPKDIVSGDFYWSTRHKGKEFIAAVDCTGHGVPGAFMSFIGYNSLNKIVKEHNITKPSDILIDLNIDVATALHQKGKDIVNDGMDIGLVSYDMSTKILEYAGAFNPMLLIQNGKAMETRANRFSIGRSTGREREFTNHSFHVEKGDMMYLFTDGFADQFGGEKGKKFKTKNLKDLLYSIHHKSNNEQIEYLENAFNQWKGDNDQIDDVLIIGRRF